MIRSVVVAALSIVAIISVVVFFLALLLPRSADEPAIELSIGTRTIAISTRFTVLMLPEDTILSVPVMVGGRNCLGTGWWTLNGQLATITVHLLLLAVVTGAYPALVFTRGPLRRYRRRRRGLCLACGYDLRGNTSEVCPECGRGCEPAA